MVAIATLAIAVFASIGALRLEVETDFTRNFRRGSSVVRAYEFVETHLGGAGVWDVLIPAPQSLDQTYLDRIHLAVEEAEKLEQLRALEHGIPIRVWETAHRSLRVDTSKDVESAAEKLQQFDGIEQEHERALARVLPALAKYWHNKRGPGFMAEAMECLGGIGYVEESPLARLYREAPVNSIWEGSGNVICLDLLRVLSRHPESVAALRTELARAQGQQADFDRALAGLERDLARPAEELEPRARWLTQRLAQCLQAALLLRHAPTEVATTFCRARLGDEAGPAYGVLPGDAPLAAILARIGS